MKFIFGLSELNFVENASYPASRPIEKLQVSDRTAAGVMQSEELGITLRRRVLSFEDMSKVDHDNLKDWFDNIVNGSQFSFEFIDERNFSGIVKFVENVFDFTEVDFELFSGSITLEYQP